MSTQQTTEITAHEIQMLVDQLDRWEVPTVSVKGEELNIFGRLLAFNDYWRSVVDSDIERRANTEMDDEKNALLAKIEEMRKALQAEYDAHIRSEPASAWMIPAAKIQALEAIRELIEEATDEGK